MSTQTTWTRKVSSFRKTPKKQLFIRLTSAFYRKVLRKVLPKVGSIYYAGIKVSNDKRLFDTVLNYPFIPKSAIDKPTYEQTLIKELQKHVQPSSRVVIVGAGVGITAVVAQQLISKEGSVICYESSLTQYKRALKTLQYNGIKENIQLINATVAENIGVYNQGSATTIPVGDLPNCDILQLDCEGAERLILQDMKIRPKTVIVETHGMFGAPTKVIQDILTKKGYAVEKIDVAEPRIYRQCVENDIYILTGILNEDNCS